MQRLYLYHAIVERRKSLRYPLMNKYISKMWYIHTMEYYSVLKREEILTHSVAYMNLEDLMLSEISQLGTGGPCPQSQLLGSLRLEESQF
jgi:hypothetical protein